MGRGVFDAFLYRHLPLPLARYATTLRHLRPRQLFWRPVRMLQRWATLLRGPVRDAPTRWRVRLSREGRARWRRAAAERARRLRGAPVDPGAGRFCFLNQTVTLGWPPNWRGGHADDRALWRFHLHYFDWLGTLDPTHAGEAMLDWIERNPRGAPGCFGGPWSSYTIARRLPNWALWFAAHGHTLQHGERRRILDSMAAQAAWLGRRLEWEHGANHLLENLLALAMMARFFGRASARVDALLQRELREQFPDGGMHYEGSPGYQVELTARLGELLAVLAPGESLAEALEEIIGRSEAFMRHLATPAGTLPLLGDTAEADVSRAVEQRAASPTRLVYTVRDQHVVVRGSAGGYLLVDAANAGPDFCGAHQHADLLGLEYWIDGRPVIVDGGAGVYREGPRRAASRGPREHATLAVEGDGPLDPWRSFRVGRRGHCCLYDVRMLTPDSMLIDAGHDGFAHRGFEHRRRVIVADDWRMEVRDTLVAVSPWAGRCAVEAYWPLAPGLVVSIDGLTAMVHDLRCGEPVAEIHFHAGEPARMEVAAGWYWRGFGDRVSRQVLVLATEASPTGVELRTVVTPAPFGRRDGFV